MKHEDLKQNDIIIFKRYCDILEREDFQDGSVIAVYSDIQKVAISWLEGYKSRVDEVEYEKVIAKYDSNGKHMKFGIFSGNSVLLDTEDKECNFSENGKCVHYYSEGELKCNGTGKEQCNCMVYNEVGI